MPSADTPITPTRALGLMLLTGAAGMLDALCYLRAKVFAANMTGNVVLLGLDLAQKQESGGGWNLAAVLAFVAGAFLAGWIVLKVLATKTPAAEMKAGLTLELPFLLGFASLCLMPAGKTNLWVTAGIVITGSGAMAVQSLAVRRLKISGVVTTFITGTITTAVADWISGEKQVKSPVNQPLLLFGMLIAYVVAAGVAGKFESSRIPFFLPFLSVALVRFGWPFDEA